jgi:predicted metal-dependent peptidase
MSDVGIKNLLPKHKTEGVSEKAKRHLTTAKIDLVRSYPFIGFLIMSTEYRFTDEIPTLAATTIGNNIIFINEKFIEFGLKSRKERAFVIAHEVLHIFLEHVGRQREMVYHPPLFNVAADFCINSFLKELNDDKFLKMPSMGLYDKKYVGMSADKIYHILLQDSGGDHEKAAGKYGARNIGGDYSGGGQRPFDEISDENISDSKRTENRQKLAAGLAQNDANNLKNMGSGAADLIRAFQDLIESRIPWRQVLREFITETNKCRYTYNRISRRSSKSVIFPTMTGDHVSLLFGVDTSGSMSPKDLSDAMSELRGILYEFDGWNITFVSCDTSANVIGEYNSDDGDDFDVIDKKLIGGGGTDMNPMVRYSNEMEEPPAVNIILTDGYIPEVTEVKDIPTILVITREGNKELESKSCEILFMDND